MRFGHREIGKNHPPFVIPEIGINHEGDLQKAMRMVDDAHEAGAECVKFQRHVLADEMSAAAKKVVPGNADESIWDIMARCALSDDDHWRLKDYAESKGMMYICTPFSRAAADKLEAMDVVGYKIGSGECNNYPLIDHIASFGKPIILSTGMNSLEAVRPAVEIFEARGVDYSLLHCTSMYPTPYSKVRLGGIEALGEAFPNAVLGLSDHSLGNYTCFGAVALGASILEKHFTSDPNWPGPDVPISITPEQLARLIEGSRAIHEANGGTKDVLPEEQPTIDFAYACVVATSDIAAGDRLSEANIWVKRPGTGEIFARDYKQLIGRVARSPIRADEQLRWEQVHG